MRQSHPRSYSLTMAGFVSSADAPRVPGLVRVLVAHHTVLFAEALAAMIAGQPGIEVVDRCGRDSDLAHALRHLRPDVLIVGPRRGAALREIVVLARSLGSETLMVAEESAVDLEEAIRAGVTGYVSTACSATHLGEAVRRLANHEVVVLGAEAGSVLAGRGRVELVSPLLVLTAREREILKLVATGRSNGDIAGDLFISRHTVRTHIQNIRTKLNVRSKLEAALVLIRAGGPPASPEIGAGRARASDPFVIQLESPDGAVART